MNRHRDDLALVTDFSDFRRDSRVRARVPASSGHVVVLPTILLTQDCRCERHIEAAAKALALQAAKLQKLLAEPLTQPLGSMRAPPAVPSKEAATLVQAKKVGHLPVAYARTSQEPLRRQDHSRFSGADSVPARCGLRADSSAEAAGTSFASPSDRGWRPQGERARHNGRPRYERGDEQPAENALRFSTHVDGAITARPRYELEADEASPARLALYAERSRFDGAQTARPGYELELTTQSETVLQRVRDQAHARLASLEADAANGKVSQRGRALQARPVCAAQQRLDTLYTRPRSSTPRSGSDETTRANRAEAFQEGFELGHGEGRTMTPRSTATAPARSDAPYRAAAQRSGGPARAQRDGHGLTDARNALRNAYAASKVRSPSAPPRSSAKNAGIVDGWERLQGRKPGRTHPRAALPWAAGLGACSMLLAYALTLSFVPASDLPQPSAAVSTQAVRTDPLTRSELDEPPAPDAPSSQAQSHTNTGTKTQRTATRPTARMNCREHTRRTNYPAAHSR